MMTAGATHLTPRIVLSFALVVIGGPGRGFAGGPAERDGVSERMNGNAWKKRTHSQLASQPRDHLAHFRACAAWVKRTIQQSYRRLERTGFPRSEPEA
jgi:hypothetical protein